MFSNVDIYELVDPLEHGRLDQWEAELNDDYSTNEKVVYGHLKSGNPENALSEQRLSGDERSRFAENVTLNVGQQHQSLSRLWVWNRQILLVLQGSKQLSYGLINFRNSRKLSMKCERVICLCQNFYFVLNPKRTFQS